MARYRSRSGGRSLSPSRRSRTPPRGRKRYEEEPRDRHRESRSYRDRRSPAPSGLLVRNLPLDARSEDLRIPFERFGPVKDVYLPKNYYTGEPRGFGFVKFQYGKDAAEAQQQLNHTVIGGREIRIVFAEENRKTPIEMRTTSRVSGRYGGGTRRRSPPRSPRRRYRSYSRSPSPTRNDSRTLKRFRNGRARNGKNSSVKSKSVSRSPTPRDGKNYRNERSPSPRDNGQGPHEGKQMEPSRSNSPRGNSPSPHSRSQSYSPRG